MCAEKDFDATEHFGDKHSNIYDEKIRRVIRGYEEMHDLSYYLLKDCLAAQAKILVSGLGTGHEAITYATKEEGWRITGVDPTPEMIRNSKARIKDLGLEKRITVMEGTVADVKQKNFDAATSILVMQFLKDNGAKENYLKDIAHRLNRGGKIIVIDLEGDKNSKQFQTLMSAWRCHQFSSRNDHEQVIKDFTHVDADLQFVSQERMEQLLEGAGFTHICKFYQSYLFGGYLAEKGVEAR